MALALFFSTYRIFLRSLSCHCSCSLFDSLGGRINCGCRCCLGYSLWSMVECDLDFFASDVFDLCVDLFGDFSSFFNESWFHVLLKFHDVINRSSNCFTYFSHCFYSAALLGHGTFGDLETLFLDLGSDFDDLVLSYVLKSHQVRHDSVSYTHLTLPTTPYV